MADAPSRILIIKLGALGDFVQALGPMKAIRDHHPDAHITLLTTAPYVAFAEASGTVDAVWIDTRPKAWNVMRILKLRQRFNQGRFERVYDLQTSGRSSGYYKLFADKPEWSGIVPDASHPHANPNRDHMHTLERQAEQLAMAGIEAVPTPDLSWADADVSDFGLEGSFVLMLAGGAAHRPAKRWPPDRFAAVANACADAGLTPVLLGTGAERAVLDRIQALCPRAVNLADRTDFLQIATLARRADCALGNDTGPMHLIAAAGCRSVVLYSHASNPDLCAQRGPAVTLLRAPTLSDLSVEAVCHALDVSAP